MFLIISHSLIAAHFLPHLLISLQVTATGYLHFLIEDLLDTPSSYHPVSMFAINNLSVVINHHPGVDIEDDHCDDRKDCKSMGHIPINNKSIEWSLPLCITRKDEILLITNVHLTFYCMSHYSASENDW